MKRSLNYVPKSMSRARLSTMPNRNSYARFFTANVKEYSTFHVVELFSGYCSHAGRVVSCSATARWGGDFASF